MDKLILAGFVIYVLLCVGFFITIIYTFAEPLDPKTLRGVSLSYAIYSTAFITYLTYNINKFLPLFK